jgi:hypothetical protein
MRDIAQVYRMVRWISRKPFGIFSRRKPGAWRPCRSLARLFHLTGLAIMEHGPQTVAA